MMKFLETEAFTEFSCSCGKRHLVLINKDVISPEENERRHLLNEAATQPALENIRAIRQEACRTRNKLSRSERHIRPFGLPLWLEVLFFFVLFYWIIDFSTLICGNDLITALLLNKWKPDFYWLPIVEPWKPFLCKLPIIYMLMMSIYCFIRVKMSDIYSKKIEKQIIDHYARSGSLDFIKGRNLEKIIFGSHRELIEELDKVPQVMS